MDNENAKFVLVDDNWTQEYLTLRGKGITLPEIGVEYTMRMFLRAFCEGTTKIQITEIVNPEIPVEGCMYQHEPAWPLEQFRPLNAAAEKLVAFSKFRTCHPVAGTMEDISFFDPGKHKNNDNYFKPGFLLIQEQRIKERWQDETVVAEPTDVDIDGRIKSAVMYGARFAAYIDSLQRRKLQLEKQKNENT